MKEEAKSLFVIPDVAQRRSGLRRQDAVANIGVADGPKGEPRMRRVIHFDLAGKKKWIPGSARKQRGRPRNDDKKRGTANKN
ncbi:MAG: hypothetical protein EPN36_16105 [Rhodanobacteraceae bacterium]|nr:MAG: hypothetical protein EPN36_16105 [Rhodanobacteraceae bacterium]